MKKIVAAAVSGVIFATGLFISGMTDPRRVVGFLDVTGKWDPTLGFVMAGAVAVYLVAQKLILRRRRPLADSEFHVPENRRITPSLLVGAALFGAGWGLAGYCPGPALVSLAGLHKNVLIFVAAMIAGMLAHQRIGRNQPAVR